MISKYVLEMLVSFSEKHKDELNIKLIHGFNDVMICINVTNNYKRN